MFSGTEITFGFTSDHATAQRFGSEEPVVVLDDLARDTLDEILNDIVRD